MRKIYIVTLLITLIGPAFINNLMAQPNRQCASQMVYEKQLKESAKFRNNHEKIEARYNTFLKTKNARPESTDGRTIPVYVHIIYNQNNLVQNISDAQVASQIAALNRDFNALNSDISNVPAEFSGLVASYGIEFVLEGITRKSSTRTEWGTNDDMKKSSLGGVDPITPDTHLNMWVCVIGGGILGYAQFPGGAPETDGLVMSPQYFGSSVDDNGSFYLSAPYDKGRTATHEVGHYFNLRHIWGDGDCSVDDFVEDTPTAAAPNYQCPSYPSKSCASNGGFTSDMFMNYMDYVDDDCMNMFTEGQKIRTASIFAPGGARENLGYTCDIGKISDVVVSDIGDAGFDIGWSPIVDAVSYDVSINNIITNVLTTEFNAIGLDPGAEYSVKVRANCAEGVGVFSDIANVVTTGQLCVKNSELTLTLHFDEYPEETSWKLYKDEVEVASGDNFSPDLKFSTVTETFNFGVGLYRFSIYDEYGDGICCTWGNGYYDLKNALQEPIISGSYFTDEESFNFCLYNSAPVVNNQLLSIDENSEEGAIVGKVVTKDDNGDLLAYEITEGNDSGLFSINTNGEIIYSSSSPLDFESVSTYNLTVSVDDGNGGTDTASITVNINDANDAPIITTQSFTIDENSAIGTVLGMISATDQDNDTFDLSITQGNDADLFALSSEGELSVKTNELNFEVLPSYQLTITADDNLGGVSSADFTITLNDLNDVPTIENQELYVNENISAGTVIGSIMAHDEDNDVLTYTITSGNMEGLFQINSSTGQLVLAEDGNLNYELNSDYSIEVEVNDGLSNGVSAQVIIVVQDQNDIPQIDNYEFTLNEGSANGTVLGTVVGTDEDMDVLNYKLTSGNENNAFTINSATGELSVSNSLELLFSKHADFLLNVRVDDGNDGVENSEVTVRLNRVTAVDLPNEKITVQMYPNPTYGLIYFNELPLNIRNYQLLIYDMTGQLKVNNNYTQNNLVEGIDLGQINSGNYIMILSGQEEHFTLKRKLIVAKK